MEETLKYLDEFTSSLVYAFKEAPRGRKKLFYLAAIWALTNFKKGLLREVIEN